MFQSGILRTQYKILWRGAVMAEKKTNGNTDKIRYGKCSMCMTRTEHKLLFILPKTVGLEPVKMCGSCGNKKIEEWNFIVRQEAP